MSTTSPTDGESAIDCCSPADVTPVTLEAASLESTAPEYLRDLKREFAAEDLSPVELTVDACFDEDCSLATQREADRLREVVSAASFLGANRLTVDVETAASPEKVEPAVSAVRERARRDGVALDVDGLSVH